MLFTKPPAQKGAVQISPVQKKYDFRPLKMDGRADGNQKNPSLTAVNMYKTPCGNVNEVKSEVKFKNFGEKKNKNKVNPRKVSVKFFRSMENVNPEKKIETFFEVMNLEM